MSKSELEKARQKAEDLWAVVCMLDSALDGIDHALEEASELANGLKSGSSLKSTAAEVTEVLDRASTSITAVLSQKNEEHKRVALKVEALEKTSKIEALRKAQPGLYVQANSPVGVYARDVYRYGGAGVWMKNHDRVELEDVPWPLVKLEVPGD